MSNDEPENGIAFLGPVAQIESRGCPVFQTRRKAAQPRLFDPTANRTILRDFADWRSLSDLRRKREIRDQTKITRNGKAQQFADLKPGQPAEVEMQIGAGDKGMAVSVKLMRNSYQLDYRVRQLQFHSQLQSLFAATTPSGKTISGTELKRLVVHKPRFEPIWHGPSYGPSTRLDVFLLSVRPDGTVSNVEVLRATGHDVLDKPTTEWIAKWRFRPNSVVQVRVPIQLVRSGY